MRRTSGFRCKHPRGTSSTLSYLREDVQNENKLVGTKEVKLEKHEEFKVPGHLVG